MLPGFLTKALEIIVILDVCGAVVYFTLTGLLSIKKQPEQPASSLRTRQSSVLQSFGIDSPALATAQPPLPARVTPSVYLPDAPSPEPRPGRQWTAGIKRRVRSLKRAFTYRPSANGAGVETRTVDPDFERLGRVLDSFKEET